MASDSAASRRASAAPLAKVPAASPAWNTEPTRPPAGAAPALRRRDSSGGARRTRWRRFQAATRASRRRRPSTRRCSAPTMTTAPASCETHRPPPSSAPPAPLQELLTRCTYACRIFTRIKWLSMRASTSPSPEPVRSSYPRTENLVRIALLNRGCALRRAFPRATGVARWQRRLVRHADHALGGWRDGVVVRALSLLLRHHRLRR